MSAALDDLDGIELVTELERLDAKLDRLEFEAIGIRRVEHPALLASLRRMGFTANYEPVPYPTADERRARADARWLRLPKRTRMEALVKRGILPIHTLATRRHTAQPQPQPKRTLTRRFDTEIRIR